LSRLVVLAETPGRGCTCDQCLRSVPKKVNNGKCKQQHVPCLQLARKHHDTRMHLSGMDASANQGAHFAGLECCRDVAVKCGQVILVVVMQL
jgi:hypothetical protein